MEEMREKIRKVLTPLVGEKREVLMEEFALLTIDEETPYLVRAIAKKIDEKLLKYAQLLEELLQPDTNLTSMQECSFFNEREQEAIRHAYRSLMRLHRHATLAELEGGEAAYQAFLADAFKNWAELKPALQTIMKQLHAGWQQEKNEEHEEYFG